MICFELKGIKFVTQFSSEVVASLMHQLSFAQLFSSKKKNFYLSICYDLKKKICNK